MIVEKSFLFGNEQYYGMDNPLLLFKRFFIDSINGEEIKINYEFVNLSNKEIVGIYFSFCGLSLLNEKKYYIDNFSDIDISVKSNEIYSSLKHIIVKNGEIRKCEVILKNIVFSDGSIWENKELKKCLCYPKFEKINFEKRLLIEATRQLGVSNFSNFKFIPYQEENFWYCTCGHINFKGEICSKCGLNKDLQFNVLNKEYLQNEIKRKEQERFDKIEENKKIIIDKGNELSNKVKDNSAKLKNDALGIIRENGKMISEKSNEIADQIKSNADEIKKLPLKNLLLTKKSILIITVFFIVLMFGLYGVSYYKNYNSDFNKFVRYIESESYDSASVLYICIDDETKFEVDGYTISLAQEYFKEYKNEIITSTELSELLKKLDKATSHSNKDLSMLYRDAQEIARSDSRLSKGLEYCNQGEYEKALEHLSEVDEKNNEYQKSLEYIELCNKKIEEERESKKKEIESFLDLIDSLITGKMYETAYHEVVKSEYKNHDDVLVKFEEIKEYLNDKIKKYAKNVVEERYGNNNQEISKYWVAVKDIFGDGISEIVIGWEGNPYPIFMEYRHNMLINYDTNLVERWGVAVNAKHRLVLVAENDSVYISSLDSLEGASSSYGEYYVKGKKVNRKEFETYLSNYGIKVSFYENNGEYWVEKCSGFDDGAGYDDAVHYLTLQEVYKYIDNYIIVK